MTHGQVLISAVSTVYNDSQIVPKLVKELSENLSVITPDFEIILVDDCSPDNSLKAIEDECARNPKVKGISMSRNFGQQIAMSAGVRYASGKYVVILDGDLQNPPSEIPRMFNEISKGFDVVYTVSKERNNVFDKFTSAIFWFLLTRIFGVRIIKNQLMLKIMTSEFAGRFNQYNEINRTVTGIVHDISSHYSVLTVQNQKRDSGHSHYSFLKRFNLMIDILISLSNAPLNMMIYFGLTIFVLTMLIAFYQVFVYLFLDVPAGYTSVVLSIFFFGSLIVLLLGFIGRYLSNIYTEVKSRPLYHVRQKMNL